MDALAHAIEGYTNMRANIMSDMYAETAIKLIAENLRLAYYKGSKNLESRYNMALAATIAVKVMDFTGGGIIVHGMGHSLQSFVHISHGTSLAILLPYAMEFNMHVDQRKYTRIAELLGEKTDGIPLREAASKAVEAVKKLSLDMALPQRLREVGIKKEQIPLIVDNLFTLNLKSVNSNPRECTREDAKKIYESAW
jgi:alcohol dehydrogenase class IV